MNDNFLILEAQLKEMESIINAMPGEAYRNKAMDTILILQRRMKESELKQEMETYNEIFSKKDAVEIVDIVRSATSFVAIRMLVTHQQENLDAHSIRRLMKEYKAQITKIKNIIHLTKVNGMTADSYQKEKIAVTLDKNESLKEAYEEAIGRLEKRIERMPLPKEEDAEEEQAEKKGRKGTKESATQDETEARNRRNVPRMWVMGFFESLRNEKEVLEHLRSKEKEDSKTLCAEIPYYDSSLSITKKDVCKDIPEFTLVKRKNNIYFAKTSNVGSNSVKNVDQSLLELTEANEEFYQFMTIDFFGEDYELERFTEKQKEGLYMYFDFITRCFEKHIGTILTVREYLEFKRYYNALSLRMVELERRARKKEYRARFLAEEYLLYMDCYEMEHSIDVMQIVADILDENIKNYMDDIQLILDHNLMHEKAKDDLKKLINEFMDFHQLKEDRLSETKVELANEKGIYGALDPTPESIDPNLRFHASDYNDSCYIGAEDFSYIQIKVQLQNEEMIVTDEALFSVANVKKAVYDYLSKRAYLKKIGLYMNEKDVVLFSSKGGSLSVPVLDDAMRKVKHLDAGIQGQLVDFYEEKIRKMMMELSQ